MIHNSLMSNEACRPETSLTSLLCHPGFHGDVTPPVSHMFMIIISLPLVFGSTCFPHRELQRDCCSWPTVTWAVWSLKWTNCSAG